MMRWIDGRAAQAAGVVMLSAAVAAVPGAQGAGGAQAGSTRTSVDSAWISEAAERRALAEVAALREQILSYATFAGFADGACAPGDVRTFERDTADVVPRLLRRLELRIVAHGAAASLDTEAGRALLQAVTRIEVGGPGPRWDVLSGEAPRAFNPMLPTRLLNTSTNACEDTPGRTPFGIVLPPVTGFEPPRDPGMPPYLVEHGPDGVRRLRDGFFSIAGNTADAVLRHTRVVGHALWGDYAIVAVARDAELRGVLPEPMDRSGATYAWHRANGEWRLLAVVRNW